MLSVSHGVSAWEGYSEIIKRGGSDPITRERWNCKQALFLTHPQTGKSQGFWWCWCRWEYGEASTPVTAGRARKLVKSEGCGTICSDYHVEMLFEWVALLQIHLTTRDCAERCPWRCSRLQCWDFPPLDAPSGCIRETEPQAAVTGNEAELMVLIQKYLPGKNGMFNIYISVWKFLHKCGFMHNGITHKKLCWGEYYGLSASPLRLKKKIFFNYIRVFLKCKWKVILKEGLSLWSSG